MKLVFAYLVLPSGERVPLTGPLEVETVTDGGEVLGRHNVNIAVGPGSRSLAQASGGSASVSVASHGFSVRMDIKPK